MGFKLTYNAFSEPLFVILKFTVGFRFHMDEKLAISKEIWKYKWYYLNVKQVILLLLLIRFFCYACFEMYRFGSCPHYSASICCNYSSFSPHLYPATSPCNSLEYTPNSCPQFAAPDAPDSRTISHSSGKTGFSATCKLSIDFPWYNEG